MNYSSTGRITVL